MSKTKTANYLAEKESRSLTGQHGLTEHVRAKFQHVYLRNGVDMQHLINL